MENKAAPASKSDRKDVNSSKIAQIAIIHNTNVHVETAVSLYFTLERSELWSPTLILLPSDVRGLNAFLNKLGVRYLTADIPCNDFEKAIVITSYPSGAEYKRLPNENHPIVREFEGRRILVTHRANYPISAYKGEAVMGLTPLCEQYGIPFVYACENPALETSYLEDWDNKIFLIQGKFGAKHRNFNCLRRFLEVEKRPFRIRLLGESASSVELSDDRAEFFQRVSEIEFYNLCRTSHFILPLIDAETRRAQYLRSRFSSTYGIAFASGKLLIADENVNAIYNMPAITYSSCGEFCSVMSECLDMTIEHYVSQCEQFFLRKKKMRDHNTSVLVNLLSI